MCLTDAQVRMQVASIVSNSFPAREFALQILPTGDEYNTWELEKEHWYRELHSYSRPVIQRNIKAVGMCPHHILPINYTITIAYVPKVPQVTFREDGEHSETEIVASPSVLGLSKLARLVDTLAKRPTLQEIYTKDVIDVLLGNSRFVGGPVLASGAAVVVEGQHMCMAARGVKSPASTITYDSKFISHRHAMQLYLGHYPKSWIPDTITGAGAILALGGESGGGPYGFSEAICMEKATGVDNWQMSESLLAQVLAQHSRA